LKLHRKRERVGCAIEPVQQWSIKKGVCQKEVGVERKTVLGIWDGVLTWKGGSFWIDLW